MFLELEAGAQGCLGHLELLGCGIGGGEAVLKLVARLRERFRETAEQYAFILDLAGIKT